MQNNITSGAPGLEKWMLSVSCLSHASCIAWIWKLLARLTGDQLFAVSPKRPNVVQSYRWLYRAKCTWLLSSTYCILTGKGNEKKKKRKQLTQGCYKLQNKKETLCFPYTCNSLLFAFLAVLCSFHSVSVCKIIIALHNLQCWCHCGVWCLAVGFIFIRYSD